MPRKAIIADDDETIRNLFEAAITRAVESAEVYSTAEPSELVREARNGGYSLVITDYDMRAGMTGADAVREIRSFDPDIPVYIASGDEVANAAVIAGATGYVMKGRVDTLDAIKFLAKKHLGE